MTEPSKVRSTPEGTAESGRDVEARGVKNDIREQLQQMHRTMELENDQEGIRLATEMLQKVDALTPENVRNIGASLQTIANKTAGDTEAQKEGLRAVARMFGEKAEKDSEESGVGGKISAIMEKIKPMMEQVKAQLLQVDSGLLSMLYGALKNFPIVNEMILKAMNDPKPLLLFIKKTLGEALSSEQIEELLEQLTAQLSEERVADALDALQPPYSLFDHVKATISSFRGTVTVDALVTRGAKMIEKQVTKAKASASAAQQASAPAKPEAIPVTKVDVPESGTVSLLVAANSTDAISIAKTPTGVTLASNGKQAAVTQVEAKTITKVETQAATAAQGAKVILTMVGATQISIDAAAIRDAAKNNAEKVQLTATRLPGNESFTFEVGFSTPA